MFQQEAAILFLGTWQVADDRFEPIAPIAIVEVVGPYEMSAREKTGDEADLLPRTAIFALGRF